MPRLARRYLESCYFHVIVQGINKEFIFKTKELKESYKKILKKNLSETKIMVLGYCIMDNHAHFLLYGERPEEISKLMQKTNTSFAKLYNKLNSRVGYVFRDRYYVQMILTEKQLFNCLAYIHKNPIKANIVTKENDYFYSSYNEYLGKRELITEESVILVFNTNKNFENLFFRIHMKDDIEDIADIKEIKKSGSEIIKDYLKNCNKSINELKLNETEFAELLLELRHSGGLSLREMSSVFGVNKDRLNKIINSKL